MKKSKKQSKNSVQYAAVTLIAVTLVGGYYLISKTSEEPQIYGVTTDAAQLNLSFAQSFLAPRGVSQVEVVVEAREPVSASDITLNFDPKQMQLKAEVAPTPLFGRVIDVTSMADANRTGAIHIKLAQLPSQIDTAQTGTFSLASLSFAPVSKDVTSARLSLDSASSELLNPLDYGLQPVTAEISFR